MSTTPTIIEAFNARAEGYDRHLEPILGIKDLLHQLIRSQFSGLPAAARILVVGEGTNAFGKQIAVHGPAGSPGRRASRGKWSLG